MCVCALLQQPTCRAEVPPPAAVTVAEVLAVLMPV